MRRVELSTRRRRPVGSHFTTTQVNQAWLAAVSAQANASSNCHAFTRTVRRAREYASVNPLRSKWGKVLRGVSSTVVGPVADGSDGGAALLVGNAPVSLVDFIRERSQPVLDFRDQLTSGVCANEDIRAMHHHRAEPAV